MAQVTLRMPDEVAEELKAAARVQGQSLNAWAVSVLRAAGDPNAAGEQMDRMRERLARAGILRVPTRRARRRPDPGSLERAMRAAAKGKSLSEYVVEERGEHR